MENKQQIITSLKQKCEAELKNCKNDKKKMLIFTTISSFLDDGEDFFTSTDVEIALNVLMDLGYKKEEAKELYLKLICQK